MHEVDEELSKDLIHATNGIIPRVHSNVKRVPRWKTKISIDITVATAMKKSMDYQVLVEMSTELLNRLYFYQQKRVINRFIAILSQVLKTIVR